MNMFAGGQNQLAWWVVMPIVIVDLVLRGYALWKSARAGHQKWFIALLIINSIGILPAIYLLIHKDATTAKHKK